MTPDPNMVPGGIMAHEHVDFTNGQTCNCVQCVEKRGFILCTKPMEVEDMQEMVFFKRPKPEYELVADPKKVRENLRRRRNERGVKVSVSKLP